MLKAATVFVMLAAGASAELRLRGDDAEAHALPADGDEVDTSFGAILLGDNEPSARKVEAATQTDEGSASGAVEAAAGSDSSASGSGEDSASVSGSESSSESGSEPGSQCVKLSISYGNKGETKGDVTVELDAEVAPLTVANFLRYVDAKYYDATVFHRVINNFMIQGGGFTDSLYKGDTSEKPGAFDPIQNEASEDVKNLEGTLSMARTSDPNSASSQFFINLVSNPSLDKRDGPGNEGYAVFGKTVAGFPVVQAVGEQSTGSVSGFDDVPETPVMMESATRVACPPDGDRADSAASTQ
jgi:cyclophilin family peptidyl-prolyl cis-trans isomerase